MMLAGVLMQGVCSLLSVLKIRMCWYVESVEAFFWGEGGLVISPWANV